MNNRPDRSYLLSILSYDKDTGEFTWLERRGTAKPGKKAGAKSPYHPYIHIKIDKHLYKAHQIAWLFHYGKWPDFDLDHIDGDGRNNRISNLRRCTMSQNLGNRKLNKNSTTRMKGVSRRRGYDRYRAYINYKGKRIHLGEFSTAEEASATYARVAKQLFGEFARVE